MFSSACTRWLPPGESPLFWGVSGNFVAPPISPVRTGLFVRPRKSQTVTAPGSGTRSGLIRTVQAGRTIAPTLDSVYGPGRLRGQNLAAPVSDGEIASACEMTSRHRSHTMFAGPTYLSWPLACESASGTRARLRQSSQLVALSFFVRNHPLTLAARGHAASARARAAPRVPRCKDCGCGSCVPTSPRLAPRLLFSPAGYLRVARRVAAGWAINSSR